MSPLASWQPQSMLAFDLETTGPNPHTAHIVTASLVEISGRETKEHNLLAEPGVEIPEGATAVHGITTEHARAHGKPHADVLRDVIAAIYRGWDTGRALVVFNAAYDLTILQRWDPSFEVRGLVVDPFVLDRALDPFRKGPRTLRATAEHYGIVLNNAHNSAADSLAAARIAWKIASQNHELTEISGSTLMEHQAQWHRERQTSFAEYLLSKGRDASDVNAGWPIATSD